VLQSQRQLLQGPGACLCARQRLHRVSHLPTTRVEVILCVGMLNVRGHEIHLCAGLSGSHDNSPPSSVDNLNATSLHTKQKENSSKITLLRLLRRVVKVRRAILHAAHTWLPPPLS